MTSVNFMKYLEISFEDSNLPNISDIINRFFNRLCALESLFPPENAAPNCVWDVVYFSTFMVTMTGKIVSII